MDSATHDPHHGLPVITAGAPLTSARAAVILLHGRGDSAEVIMRLTRRLPAEGVSYLAPQARDQAWYPQRFHAPFADNEPGLHSALGVVQRLIEGALTARIARERIFIGGFSQGACLALETATRLGGRFGGIFALSGALMGAEDEARPFDRPLDGTPVFNACGDADGYFPLVRVHETTRTLTALDARVSERIYRGLGHVIVSDETNQIAAMIRAALAR